MKEVTKSKKQVASPCAACKLLRRRCTQECMFAPHFPADQPQIFANVHRIFGASNVSKLLQELPEQHRSDAVSSMVYEANARVRDPVYGCVGAISSLQQQVEQLQTQLAITQAELLHTKLRQSFYSAQPGHSPVDSATTTNGSVSLSGSSSMTPTSLERSMFDLDYVAEQNDVERLMWSY